MIQERRFNPRHLYSLPIVGGCALNPKKTAVAFAVVTAHEESNAYRGSIKAVDDLDDLAAVFWVWPNRERVDVEHSRGLISKPAIDRLENTPISMARLAIRA